MDEVSVVDRGTLHLDSLVKYSILRTDCPAQPTLLVFNVDSSDLCVVFSPEGRVLGAMNGARLYARALELKLRSTYTGDIYSSSSKWAQYGHLIAGFFENERD